MVVAFLANWLVPMSSGTVGDRRAVLAASTLPPLLLLPVFTFLPGVNILVYQLCILTIAIQIYSCRKAFESSCPDVTILGGLGFPCFALGFVASAF